MVRSNVTSFYQHVYLSPHYDDAVLSCGGSIHRQVEAGELVLVMTIFAAPPESNEPLSPFAEDQHRQWGNPNDVIATRQAEDQAAIEILGADYLRLKFTDCIYRGQPRAEAWYYTSDDDLFGEIHPADRSLIPEIVEAVLELVPGSNETIVYAPLTVGHHVDHQLTHAAAWQLRRQGYNVVFYEDYPYADPEFTSRYPHNLEVVLAGPHAANLRLQLRLLSEENLAAKIGSIGAYASQIAMLFGSEAKMAAYLRGYAEYVGKGQLAERIWI